MKDSNPHPMEKQETRDPIDGLRRRGLLPPLFGLPAGEVGLEKSDVDYRDKYLGGLLGGACGDALGRPAESMSPAAVERQYGRLVDFVPWWGYESGPIGTITDDTQMTMCIAESMIERGRLDAADLAQRFIEWLPEGQGRGRTCVAAIGHLLDGKPWHEAGVESAGNGAAMRVAPVGLAHPIDVDLLRRDAALSSVITHADPMAVASAIAQAFAVAYCLHRGPEEFDVDDFASSLGLVLADVEDPGAVERRPGADGHRVKLADRLQEALAMVGEPADQVFSRLHNGAFVLESLPAAFWCFVSSPDDPEKTMVTAANAGYDADTVAAMAGNLSGAFNGARSLPGRWLEELEYRPELATLAEGLLDLGLGNR